MTVIKKSKLEGLNWEDARPSPIMKKIAEQEDWLKPEYVRRLKELYPKEEVLARGVTIEEYNKYKGPSRESQNLREIGRVGRIMNQVVGAEIKE